MNLVRLMLVVVVGAALPGCWLFPPEFGKPCLDNSECLDTLHICFDGQCVPADSVDAPDAGADDDAGADEDAGAGEDAGTAEDAGAGDDAGDDDDAGAVDDAGPADDGGTGADAGDDDAGAPDAGVGVDAGTSVIITIAPELFVEPSALLDVSFTIAVTGPGAVTMALEDEPAGMTLSAGGDSSTYLIRWTADAVAGDHPIDVVALVGTDEVGRASTIVRVGLAPGRVCDGDDECAVGPCLALGGTAGYSVCAPIATVIDAQFTATLCDTNPCRTVALDAPAGKSPEGDACTVDNDCALGVCMKVLDEGGPEPGVCAATAERFMSGRGRGTTLPVPGCAPPLVPALTPTEVLPVCVEACDTTDTCAPVDGAAPACSTAQAIGGDRFCVPEACTVAGDCEATASGDAPACIARRSSDPNDFPTRSCAGAPVHAAVTTCISDDACASRACDLDRNVCADTCATTAECAFDEVCELAGDRGVCRPAARLNDTCDVDADCGLASVCARGGQCAVDRASLCGAGERRVFVVDPYERSAVRIDCRATASLPFPAGACDVSTEATVILPATPFVEESAICLGGGGGGAFQKCEPDDPCLGGETCEPIVSPGPTLMSGRWNIEAPYDVGVSACVTACDTTSVDALEACLAGVATPKGPLDPAAPVNVSGGLLVPATWFPDSGCTGTWIHAGGEPGRMLCGQAGPTVVQQANMLVAPGWLAPASAGTKTGCQIGAGATSSIHSIPRAFGDAIICMADFPSTSTPSCGRAGDAAVAADLGDASRRTCPLPGVGQPKGTSPADLAILQVVIDLPAELLCASGEADGVNGCTGRAPGDVCASDAQCELGCARGARGSDHGRCRGLQTQGTAIAATTNTVDGRCESSWVSGATGTPTCGGRTGQVAQNNSDADCASASIDGAFSCLTSEAGEPCGTDFDCGVDTACLRATNRCVELAVTTGSPFLNAFGPLECASGYDAANNDCRVGARGDPCVNGMRGEISAASLDESTCGTGLACLDQVCR